MKVPEAVLERAAREAYRRSFEAASQIKRPCRDTDWEQTADEATRQHFRDLVCVPVEAALEQLREELEGPEATSRMLTILGECDWGLLHQTGDMEPAALVEQTSADLRAAIEGAFSVLGDKEKGR